MLGKSYKIITDRCIIRCYQPKDAPLLKEAIDKSLDYLLPWMPWAKFEPETLEKKIERLRNYRGQFDLGQDFIYGIFDIEETVLIGSTGLHTRVRGNAREIGYWISKEYAGQGYATEITLALTKVGFEIEGLDRIEIHCAEDNIPSRKIPQKLGYVLEAVLKNRSTDSEGNLQNNMIWTMFKEDYYQSNLSKQSIKVFDAMDRPISF